MITQRVLQIAAGYEDANDCNSLKGDNILKLCSGRAPSDKDLASQPMISRLENTPGPRALYRMGKAIFDNFIGSYVQEPKVITLDLDDTDSTTYGGQQLALYNDYYGEYCYMPLHIYEAASGKLGTICEKSDNMLSLLNT